MAGAKAFADFMVAKETQDIIKTFGVDKFGSPLFFPDAGKKEEELGKISDFFQLPTLDGGG